MLHLTKCSYHGKLVYTPIFNGQKQACKFKSVSRIPVSTVQASDTKLISWLQENGAPENKIDIKTISMPGSTQPLNLVVAKEQLSPGDVALTVPEHLVITLDRVFESEFVAELLTTDKLSELACLTLYLMYEKKTGKSSFWYPYIQVLDRQRARGAQAVESPLLWSDEELEEYLQGSPLLQMVKERLVGIEKEYQELDTVWFMAGSLFNKYPFDIPTEAFSFTVFKQAFAAIQASIVHLQGVPLARRFALVPLGPPLLAYSSSCKALLSYNPAVKGVQLTVDRAYAAGSPVLAWCGPQPNSRLLLNYGIVDEHNPFDKLQMTVTMPNNDPLFQQKRAVLHQHNLITQQTFDMRRDAPLPPALLPYMRLAVASTKEEVEQATFGEGAKPADPITESAILEALSTYFTRRLQAYKRPLWEDIQVAEDPNSRPRQKVAARLTKIEKGILGACLGALTERGKPGNSTFQMLPALNAIKIA